MSQHFHIFILMIAGFFAANAQGTWSSKAPMPTARHAFATAATPDGKIYAIGGATFPATYASATVNESYDPATNTWSSNAPMPSPRYNVSGAYSNGKIYVFGGYYFGPSNAVEAYDPVSNSWTIAAPMPTARHNIVAVTAGNGKIYVMGGDTAGGGQNVAVVEVYDPMTNSWTAGPSMPNTKSGFTANLGLDGKIYAIGGGQSGIRTTSVFALDIVTNQWTEKNPMTSARSNLSSGRTLDGRIVVMGGEDGSPGTVVPLVELYDPVADTWSLGSPLPTARGGLGVAASLDGRLFAIGGWIPIPGGLQPQVANEAYQPITSPQYQVCALFDSTKPVKSGATLPIKLQLCDSNRNNLSSAAITLHATSITKLSNSTSTEIQDAGNSNPDNDFRFDPTLGSSGGYIFNLKTTGLSSGTYQLAFTIGTSLTTYSVQFQVK